MDHGDPRPVRGSRNLGIQMQNRTAVLLQGVHRTLLVHKASILQTINVSDNFHTNDAGKGDKNRGTTDYRIQTNCSDLPSIASSPYKRQVALQF